MADRREYFRAYNARRRQHPPGWTPRHRWDGYVKKIRHPRARAAWNLVHRAVASGALVPDRCHCGKPGEAHHHRGYERPLDVIWLCRLHHIAAHKEATDVLPE